MGNKKIRRRRQKSLFSMTSAGEYSLLDSGRVSASFDPMNISRSLRPQIGVSHSSGDLDSREPPSLDLLAEMIKEEIRQASSLKQALERVNIETESISQRVSNISIADNMDADRLSSLSLRTGSNPLSENASKPKKQVQFIVPDDVRFRWLGIFQQPSDSELSDNETNDDNQETTFRGSTTAATLAPPHHEPQVTRPTSANELDTHAHKPSAAAVSVDNARQMSADSGAVLPTDAELKSYLESLAANDIDMKQGDVTIPSSSTDTPSNTSLEAVYGGSRSDTRAMSVLQSAQINSASQIVTRSDKTTDERLLQSCAGAISTTDDHRSATDSIKPLVSNRIATISGRSSRRLSSPTQSSEPRVNGNHPASDLDGANKAGHHNSHLSKTTGRSVNGSSPFSAKPRASVSNSTFSQPAFATARTAAPKRYSALQLFAPPQMPAPSAITSTPSSKPDKSEAVRSRLPSGLQRSGSTLDAAIQPATDASLYLRRNSYDGSSIPDRRGGLASPETDNATEITNGDAKTESRQPLPHGQPPGLLRRVTTTSAHRKPTPSHHSRMFHDEHNSILGGTKEFFKHRLRSRTNSSSLHSADAADDDATAKEHLSDMHGSDANGVQKRPRRRSDAEVKSRNAELPPPPPPAIPDQFQQRYPAAVGPRGAEKYIKSSVAKKDNIKADSLQLLHPPRTSIGDGQSEWVAISPPPSSSSTHERDTKTPPSNPLSQRQRRSHDETIRLSTDRGEYRDYRSKHREVVGPADSTIRLTKDQMDLIRLRPLNGDSKSSETRPRSRHNTNESSSPSPPPQSSRKIPSSIGRSSIERLDSPRPDGSIASSLLPKLPPPPSASLSPLSPKRHVRSDSKQALPDSDSIDHHIRRLRSDKKSRRSSFMSTISQMLGRKE